MVSSKQLTTFSDFCQKIVEPDFLSTSTYCDYLENYCTNFKLWSHIQLSTKVTKIHRLGGKGHVITYISSDCSVNDWQCNAVAICTGLHVIPNIPRIQGIQSKNLIILINIIIINTFYLINNNNNNNFFILVLYSYYILINIINTLLSLMTLEQLLANYTLI